ncbi:MAG TPA: hypothetical protein VFB22_08135 [Candidatus Baltobacteraceae bacterium]|nr:hypothetical protein [Candidatus Baltobacteraceae bacterium]
MTKTTPLDIVRPLAVGLGIFGACSAIGMAQSANPCAPGGANGGGMYGPTTWNTFDPAYNDINSWQPGWDTGAYDRNHILVGVVNSFAPYRLTLIQPQGGTMTVDLKQGTVIRPTGDTPSTGQHVAVFGYWSNGTFIANRVVLRG